MYIFTSFPVFYFQALWLHLLAKSKQKTKKHRVKLNLADVRQVVVREPSVTVALEIQIML
jgi:hypothetical protein